MDQAKTIRVPVHMMDFYSKVSKSIQRIKTRTWERTESKGNRQEVGSFNRKDRRGIQAIQDTIALQTPVGDDGTTIEEFISDKDGPTPYSDTEGVM